MIVAFCGHADYVRRADDEKIILALLENTVGNAPVEFFLGGYGRFDDLAYHCAKKFKNDHPNANLVWITPYISTKHRENDFDLILFPPIEHCPPQHAISHRNRWIAGQADVVIAYVTHEYGGAYRMYRHAKRKGKEIHNIADI